MKAKEATEGMGVPMIFAQDSNVIAEHLIGLGLLDGSALLAVEEEVVKDHGRKDVLGEVVDAVGEVD